MKNNYSSVFGHFKTHLILLVLFICSSPKAQTIQTENISISEGLTSLDIRSVIQDKYGLIWIGTKDGLFHYDGYDFVRFKNIPGKANSLQNDIVRGSALDVDQNIWVANDDGISKYNRKKNEFVNYNLGEQFNLIGNAGGRVFNLLIDSKNRMWAASAFFETLLFDTLSNNWNRVEYLLNDTNRVKIENGMTLALAEDKNKKIWIGSKQYGLMYYRESDSVFIPAKFRQNSAKIDFTANENFITFLYIDPTNTMWITTRSGVFKYNSKTGDLKTLKIYDNFKDEIANYYNSINQDNQGNIWISNNYRGILKFDGISDEFEEVSILRNGKVLGTGSAIILTRTMVDKTGIFWFGTISRGIMKYDPSNEPFLHYTSNESDESGLSNRNIFGLLESKVHPGKVYVGTRGGGLNIFDQTNRTFERINFNVISDQFGGSVRGIAEDDDDHYGLVPGVMD
ncbi:MAG: two-component regulator propeller domain-containing protein [Melioribacteraceae bacterium]